MKTTGNKRLCALLMALTLLLSAFPVTVFATGTDSPTIGSSCNHTHGEDCGYNEGADCTHAHGNTCGWAEAVACAHAHDDTCGEGGEACAHVCGEGGCAFAEETPCAHTHDGDCGYIEAAPCTHAHDEACGGLPTGQSAEDIGTNDSGEGEDGENKDGVQPPLGLTPFAGTKGGDCGAAGNEANVQWEFDDTNGLLTISGTGAMADYGSYYPTWYDLRTSIKGVVIEDGVTSIGKNAFYNCRNLTSVNIGDGVKTIGFGAFSVCPLLTSVTIPESVETIGAKAFSSCTNLTSVTFKGATPPSIGSNAFYAVASTGTVSYPASAEADYNSALSGTGLTGWGTPSPSPA